MVYGSGHPTSASTNAAGPDQSVAMTGRPIAIASSSGRPQPSPRVGATTASAAA